MTLHGTPVAQTARMRERPTSTNAPLQVQIASTESPQQPTEEQKNASVDTEDGVDKYDISTLACTD